MKPTKPKYEYQLCTRENGKQFIKIITYSKEAEGYIEVGRINPIKSEWTEASVDSMEDVYNELVQNSDVRKDFVERYPNNTTQQGIKNTNSNKGLKKLGLL